MEESLEKEYYLATEKNKNNYLIYKSENFMLSEIDLINLIKICLIEARSKIIGRKLLEVYKDSTEEKEERKNLTKERLALIGITDKEKQKPIEIKKTKIK